MKTEEIVDMAWGAGMEAYTTQPAINALGSSVPVAWLEKFAEIVLNRHGGQSSEKQIMKMWQAFAMGWASGFFAAASSCLLILYYLRH